MAGSAPFGCCERGLSPWTRRAATTYPGPFFFATLVVGGCHSHGGIPKMAKWLVYMGKSMKIHENPSINGWELGGSPILGTPLMYLVVWNMNGLFFPSDWECHHPNWLSLHHFSEGLKPTTNQDIFHHDVSYFKLQHGFPMMYPDNPCFETWCMFMQHWKLGCCRRNVGTLPREPAVLNLGQPSFGGRIGWFSAWKMGWKPPNCWR